MSYSPYTVTGSFAFAPDAAKVSIVSDVLAAVEVEDMDAALPVVSELAVIDAPFPVVFVEATTNPPVEFVSGEDVPLIAVVLVA